MKSREYIFSGKNMSIYLDANTETIEKLVNKNRCIVITDSNLFAAHPYFFSQWKTIVIPAGEIHKQQSTIDSIIQQLIKLEADRKTLLLGIGGGVVTDITGFVAGIYMRGVSFALIPTSLLAMIDAAIGGKNGIDVGIYKNLIGLIRQPDFILYDHSFLHSLPQEEWINGFAEIIKHACIKDVQLFEFLEKTDLHAIQSTPHLLATLIDKNIAIKTNIVQQDEFEKADRKLLNYGHTIGHAIENLYQLPHGHAISIGMVMAATISEEINQFASVEKQRLIQLLNHYHLPTTIAIDKQKVFDILKMDKKRIDDCIHFILLNKIGEAIIQPIPMIQLEDIFNQTL